MGLAGELENGVSVWMVTPVLFWASSAWDEDGVGGGYPVV